MCARARVCFIPPRLQIRAFLRVFICLWAETFFLQSSPLISPHFPPAISRLTGMHIYKVHFNARFFGHFPSLLLQRTKDKRR